MEIDQTLGLKKDTWYDKAVLYIATIIFIMMLVLTTVQIAIRVFNLPISGGAWWTEPVARYCLMVGTYVGAAVASRNSEHIKMTIVSNQLNKHYPAAGRLIDVLAQVLTIIFLLLLTYAGFLASVQNWNTPMADVSAIQQGWIYGPITGALAMMIFYESIHLGSLLTTTNISQQIMSKVKYANGGRE